MRLMRCAGVVLLSIFVVRSAYAAAAASSAPTTAPSHITAVTIYQGSALVTREVQIPEGNGPMEVVVSPLPAQTLDSSLYSEGTADIRILTTRFRTRALKEDTRQEVRAKEQQIKTLSAPWYKQKSPRPCGMFTRWLGWKAGM